MDFAATTIAAAFVMLAPQRRKVAVGMACAVSSPIRPTPMPNALVRTAMVLACAKPIRVRRTPIALRPRCVRAANASAMLAIPAVA